LFFIRISQLTRYDFAWWLPVSHLELSLDHEELPELLEELDPRVPELQELKLLLE
jgi:hypothetical protein